MEKIELSKDASAFIASLKEMPSHFLPLSERKTVKDINPASKALNGLYTSKDKAVLGIPEENMTIWAPFHLCHDDNERFKIIAKEIDKDIQELAAEVLINWMNAHSEEIEEIALDKLKGDKSDDDLEKEIEAARKKMEKAIELLKSRKG